MGMDKEDLVDFLLFAGVHGLMDRPVSEVYKLWNDELREARGDMAADLWVERHKAGMVEDDGA